ISRDWAAERRRQSLASVIAVSAGIGHDPHLNCGQCAIALRAELDMRRHRVARGGANELLLAGELPHYRAPCLEHGERAQVLGDHLLLAAEASADALCEDLHVAV